MDIPKELKINQKLFGILLTIFPLHTFSTDYHSKIWLRHGNMERKNLYLLYRNATSVTTYFKIPINRVIELGTRIEI